MEKNKKIEFIITSLSTLGLWAIAFTAFSRELKRIHGKEQNWECEWCGKKWADGWMLEFDHRIPLSQGGKDTENNMQLLCQSCHAQKHRDDGENRAATLIESRLRKTRGRNHFG